MSEDEERSFVGGSVSSLARGKKKYYPFGAPARLHHPFSDIAHLDVDTQSFALQLSASTDILPEVVEDKPKHRRAVKKRTTAEDDDSSSLNPDAAPCTKFACQMVIRSMSEITAKNQVEKLDLEDEMERIKQDLQMTLHDLQGAEGRLEKITDVGNQLETRHDQLLAKIEECNKKKQALNDERTDINSKVRGIVSFPLQPKMPHYYLTPLHLMHE